MKLYYSPSSPFVRKVLVLLHETGQTADVTLEPASGNALEPGTMPVAKNPLGKIPCLERPDGPALYDSRVICRYLDARKGGKLYPAAPRLWDSLVLEATADGIMDAAVTMAYEVRLRPEEKRMPEIIEGQWAKVARALDTIEARWLSHLAGPLDIGQIAIAAALGYLDLRFEARNWRSGRDGLSAWAAKFAARDSMTATRPPA